MGLIGGAELMYDFKLKLEHYHADTNSHNYEMVGRKSIPNVLLHSILVIIYTPYQTVQENKPPTTPTRKADITGSIIT
jgi:hypothetical protein